MLLFCYGIKRARQDYCRNAALMAITRPGAAFHAAPRQALAWLLDDELLRFMKYHASIMSFPANIEHRQRDINRVRIFSFTAVDFRGSGRFDIQCYKAVTAFKYFPCFAF